MHIVTHVDVKKERCNAPQTLIVVVHLTKWQVIHQCNMDKNSLTMNANVCVLVTTETFHVMVIVNPGIAFLEENRSLTVIHG